MSLRGKSSRYTARRLARALLDNMRDRRGFKTDSIDAQIMRQWLDEWTGMIEAVLEAQKRAENK